MGLNQDGNKHGYNGIYELEYQENEEGKNYPKHKYKRGIPFSWIIFSLIIPIFCNNTH